VEVGGFEGFDVVAAGLEDEGGGVAGGAAEEGEALIGAEHAEGGGEAVGGGAVGGDDGDEGVVGEADAGVGVDDVGVADAVDFEALVEVAGGGDGGVAEPGDAGGGCVGGVEGADFDAPGRLAWRGVADGDIAGGGDEGAVDAVASEDGEGFVGGVAFGDAAEVEAHVGAVEGDGAAAGVEFEVLPADAGAGFGEQVRGGQFTAAPGAAPEVHHGAEGDVEGAVAAFRAVDGAGEHEPEVGADGGGLAGRGVAADAAQFAVGVVVAEGGVQFGDACVGGLGGGLGFGLGGGVGDDAEGDAHLGAGELEAGQVGRLGAGGGAGRGGAAGAGREPGGGGEGGGEGESAGGGGGRGHGCAGGGVGLRG
jgi:hypothetical protein